MDGGARLALSNVNVARECGGGPLFLSKTSNAPLARSKNYKAQSKSRKTNYNFGDLSYHALRNAWSDCSISANDSAQNKIDWKCVGSYVWFAAASRSSGRKSALCISPSSPADDNKPVP